LIGRTISHYVIEEWGGGGSSDRPFALRKMGDRADPAIPGPAETCCPQKRGPPSHSRMTRLIMPGRVGFQMGNACCFPGTNQTEACGFVSRMWKAGRRERSRPRGCTRARSWSLPLGSRLRGSVRTKWATSIRQLEGMAVRFAGWKWENNPSHVRKMGFHSSYTSLGSFQPRSRGWSWPPDGKLRWNN
jgi:hypothetical protein